MQSRSIDSYVHAVHSFQASDPVDIDFTKPVEKLHFEHHTSFTFPNFTAKNCEACHNEGTYNVPDQTQSLPSIISGADDFERNIGKIPAYVTGPAARACGSCHRSHKIKADDANGLQAFYQHVKAGGYLVEDGDGIMDVVIRKIMAIFK